MFPSIWFVIGILVIVIFLAAVFNEHVIEFVTPPITISHLVVDDIETVDGY